MLFWPGHGPGGGDPVRLLADLLRVIMLVQAIGSQGNGFLRALLGIGGVLSLVIGGICVVNGDASSGSSCSSSSSGGWPTESPT